MDDAIHLKELPETFRLRLIRQYDILQRMRRLVKHLLDLSALEIKESMDFEELNLFELAKSVHEDFVEVLEARHIDFVIHIAKGLRILGGRDSLQRVLINLVDNAIKYNVDGGKIDITAEAKHDNVYLSVFNTGKGIPEKDIDRCLSSSTGWKNRDPLSMAAQDSA